jgi:hypothetical protein
VPREGNVRTSLTARRQMVDQSAHRLKAVRAQEHDGEIAGDTLKGRERCRYGAHVLTVESQPGQLAPLNGARTRDLASTGIDTDHGAGLTDLLRQIEGRNAVSRSDVEDRQTRTQVQLLQQDLGKRSRPVILRGKRPTWRPRGDSAVMTFLSPEYLHAPGILLEEVPRNTSEFSPATQCSPSSNPEGRARPFHNRSNSCCFFRSILLSVIRPLVVKALEHGKPFLQRGSRGNRGRSLRYSRHHRLTASGIVDHQFHRIGAKQPPRHWTACSPRPGVSRAPVHRMFRPAQIADRSRSASVWMAW